MKRCTLRIPAFLIAAAILLVDVCMDAFFVLPSKSLIPSQVFRAKNQKQKPVVQPLVNLLQLVPSSVVSSRNPALTRLHASTTASTSSAPANATAVQPRRRNFPGNSPTSVTMGKNKTSQHKRKKGRRKARQGRKHNITDATEGDTTEGSPTTVKKAQQKRQQQYSYYGNLPDIHWRAVTLQDLRHHPRFEGLELPQTLTEMNSLEDARLFRQESWQWDALHNGRCTTSQAVAALGFLEPTAGHVLGVPFSWRRGSSTAFYRLRKTALRTVEEMNKVLCAGSTTADDDQSIPSAASEPSVSTAAPLWEDPLPDSSFCARYRANTTEEELQQRKIQAKKYAQSGHLGSSIRMMWGNTQEATALLTALNYFSQNESGVVIKEVGMCGAGLDLNQTNSRSSLLVGATPDALLVHSDGTVEALEVKNHCPFSTTNWNKGKRKGKGNNKNFSVRDYPFDVENAGVFSHYIPQLMMEMLCVGPECRSAVMVRQTATQGALILRMHRDDAWMDEMIYWLHRFQRDHVETGVPPPQDIFWGGEKEDSERYRAFVSRTLEIRDKVEVVAQIPNEMIQRVEEGAPFFLD